MCCILEKKEAAATFKKAAESEKEKIMTRYQK